LRKLGVGGGGGSSKGNRAQQYEQMKIMRHVRRCWLLEWSPAKFPPRRIWEKSSPSVEAPSPKRGRPKNDHASPDICPHTPQNREPLRQSQVAVSPESEPMEVVHDGLRTRETQTDSAVGTVDTSMPTARNVFHPSPSTCMCASLPLPLLPLSGAKGCTVITFSFRFPVPVGGGGGNDWGHWCLRRNSSCNSTRCVKL
jgi:hypothetical protein